jgi:hypothetical protein
MAWGNFLLDIGMDVAPAQTLTKFYAVKYSAAEQVTPVTAITDVLAGFAQFGVTTQELARGKGASVRVHGVTEAVANGAIAVGSLVTLETTGQVSAYVGASGKRIVGKCVGNAAVNAGDRISLLINPYGTLA